MPLTIRDLMSPKNPISIKPELPSVPSEAALFVGAAIGFWVLFKSLNTYYHHLRLKQIEENTSQIVETLDKE